MKSLINLIKKIFTFVSNRVDSTIENNTSDTDRILAHRNNLETIKTSINHKILEVKQAHKASQSKVEKLDTDIADRKKLYKAATTEDQKDQLARLIQVDVKTKELHEEQLDKINEQHHSLANKLQEIDYKFEKACRDYDYARELEKLGKLQGDKLVQEYDNVDLQKDIVDLEVTETKLGDSKNNELRNLEISEFRKELDAE